MRISTSQIYNTGVQGMQRNQSALLKLQNQISGETKILTPADDPVGAAQVLVVSQSLAVEEQYQTNQKSATSQLGLVDSQLSSLTTSLQTIRDSIVKAGNGSLTDTDRQSIANDIEASLSDILGIANSDNGTGDYLFSGYQGGTLPFASTGGTPVPPATLSPIAYYGDDGERLVQVSSSRQMAVTVPGSDVFMSGRNGNGTFVATTGGNTGGGINQGTAVVDAGSVLDTQKWSAAVNNAAAGTPLEIRFSVAAGVTTYGIYDPVSGATTGPLSYTTGQVIPLTTSAGVDFGAQVVVTGAPADGDTFVVAPSSSQSIFTTLQSVIGSLRSAVGSVNYSKTQLANDLAGALSNVDQATLQVSQVQSAVGTSERELDALASTSSDLVIQYKSTLSNLQDLDYTKALSDFTQQQVALDAAQKSFVQISGLSLFQYI